MAGILNSKTRVIDAVITSEGKRQIADGNLIVSYASVSDKHTYYEKDIASGSSDATKRIYFECPIKSFNDSITLESDDSGKLWGYETTPDILLRGDGVVEKLVTGSDQSEPQYTPAGQFEGFASVADKILSSSIDSFKNLYTIGTRDAGESISLRTKLSKNSYKFTISNTYPFIEGPGDSTINVDFVNPLFFDERLQYAPQFKYLPPIVMDPEDFFDPDNIQETQGIPLYFGDYVQIARAEHLQLSDLMYHLNKTDSWFTQEIHPDDPGELLTRSDMESSVINWDPDDDEDNTSLSQQGPWVKSEDSSNYGLNESETDGSRINLSSDELARERVSVFFERTSSTNNIMMQMFEIDSSKSTMLKLDIIDFGYHTDSHDSARPIKHVFFAGKIFINSYGLPVFINLFDIILD